MRPLQRAALGLLVVWWLLCAGLAAWRVAPTLPRKIVTLQLAQGGMARFAFSAAQHDHEIVYDMKTQWAPRLQTQPERYLGTTQDQPYRAYVRDALLQQWPCAVLAMVPAVGLFRVRRGTRQPPGTA